jgi:hypothetical protein
MTETKKWELQPQEQEGKYMFSGKMYVTRGVNESVPIDHIMQMVIEVKQRVIDNDGADYLQVFNNSEGEKIFIIDQLDTIMKEGRPKEWLDENDCFTVLFSHEY